MLVEDEKVVALAATGSTVGASPGPPTRPIDATGCYVIPGGVDAHTHMEMPFGGTSASDTFETGTRAAAWGGTTTIVDFAVQSMGSSLREGLDAWHAKAEGNCAIDYAFHMIMADVNEGSLKEMEAPGRRGRHQLQAVHGLSRRLLQRRRQGAARVPEGRRDRRADHDARRERHRDRRARRAGAGPRARPTRATTATSATRCSRPRRRTGRSSSPRSRARRSTSSTCRRTKALAEVAKARDEGYNAFAETCPQYLFLSYDDLARPGFEGAKYVCSTPLRPREHQAALWRGLRTNDLSVVSTDHCPFCFKGQKELGLGDFSKIPNGLPGVENRMDLLHQGVVDGHISRRRWIEIACATPARMFGLYPRKGTIAPGSDADVVVYDPNATQVRSAATHHMNVDYSCYEGTRDRPGGSGRCCRAAGWSSTRASTGGRPGTGGSSSATRAST